jgi:hypothetical protein
MIFVQQNIREKKKTITNIRNARLENRVSFHTPGSTTVVQVPLVATVQVPGFSNAGDMRGVVFTRRFEILGVREALYGSRT